MKKKFLMDGLEICEKIVTIFSQMEQSGIDTSRVEKIFKIVKRAALLIDTTESSQK